MASKKITELDVTISLKDILSNPYNVNITKAIISNFIDYVKQDWSIELGINSDLIIDGFINKNINED